MGKLISRLFALVLSFFLLVAAPFSLSVLSDNIMARYAIMNDVENFLDEVADTGKIDDTMLSNFYLDVSSHGVLVDVEVQRYVRVVEGGVSDASGHNQVTTYMLTDNIESFNTGDKVVVHVEAVGYTAGQRVVMGTIGQVLPDFDYTFPKRVR